MAKALLANHMNQQQQQQPQPHSQHSALITLVKEEKPAGSERAQCNLSLPPKLLFTPATSSKITATPAAAAAATAAAPATTIQAAKRATSNRDVQVRTNSSAARGIGNTSACQAASSAEPKSEPELEQASASPSPSAGEPHSLARPGSTDAAGCGAKQRKINQRSSGVIHRSATPSSTIGAGSGAETGNVTARLLDMGKRLLEAAREGRTDHVRQLVVSSGAPFTSDWLGTTALHLAAQHGHAEIADILMRGGVNRDARTKLERTALHLAAQSGALPVVESLLLHGCDINARDMLRMTPLHWAVERRHVDIVKRLLVGGADINLRSKFQLTPMEIAENSGYYELVQLFKGWGAKHDDCNHLGVYSDNNQQVNIINDNKLCESHDIFHDVNYQLMLAENGAINNRGSSMLDIDEPCIDLVELEWNSLKFETDFSNHHSSIQLNGDNTDDASDNIREQKSCQLECLMKMVEELQRENEQLRRRLEQISTPQSDKN